MILIQCSQIIVNGRAHTLDHMLSWILPTALLPVLVPLLPVPLLDDQVVNRDRSKFYFTLLTKIDPEPEGFTTRRHTGLGRRER